jgi:hypothetical protein
MRSNPAIRLLYITAMAGILLLYLWYAYVTISVMRLMRAPGHAALYTAAHGLPQADFARFWFVGKMLLVAMGHRLGLNLAAPSMFQLNILAPGHDVLLSWLYPPTMSLLALPLALLPLPLSFWVWRAVSVLGAGFLLRRAGLGWGVILAGLASPAGLHDMLGGQTGTFTGGILVAALLFMGRQPREAGILAGLLSIKPQMALALPLILLHPRRRRALFYGAGTAIALAAMSLLLAGFEPWRFFVMVSTSVPRQIISQPFQKFFPAAGFTTFIMARSFHASLAVASILQACVSLISAVLVVAIWQDRPRNAIARMAITVALTALMAPYGFAYDLVGFSIAMAALAPQTTGWRQVCLIGLWLCGGYTALVAIYTGLILAPLALALGVALAWPLLTPRPPAPAG